MTALRPRRSSSSVSRVLDRSTYSKGPMAKPICRAVTGSTMLKVTVCRVSSSASVTSSICSPMETTTISSAASSSPSSIKYSGCSAFSVAPGAFERSVPLLEISPLAPEYANSADRSGSSSIRGTRKASPIVRGQCIESSQLHREVASSMQGKMQLVLPGHASPLV